MERRLASHDLFGTHGAARPHPGRKAWTLDRDRRVFEPHDRMGKAEGVKSVDIHPARGRIGFAKTEAGRGASCVSFLDP